MSTTYQLSFKVSKEEVLEETASNSTDTNETADANSTETASSTNPSTSLNPNNPAINILNPAITIDTYVPVQT